MISVGMALSNDDASPATESESWMVDADELDEDDDEDSTAFGATDGGVGTRGRLAVAVMVAGSSRFVSCLLPLLPLFGVAVPSFDGEFSPLGVKKDDLHAKQQKHAGWNNSCVSGTAAPSTGELDANDKCGSLSDRGWLHSAHVQNKRVKSVSQ